MLIAPEYYELKTENGDVIETIKTDAEPLEIAVIEHCLFKKGLCGDTKEIVEMLKEMGFHAERIIENLNPIEYAKFVTIKLGTEKPVKLIFNSRTKKGTYTYTLAPLIEHDKVYTELKEFDLEIPEGMKTCATS